MKEKIEKVQNNTQRKRGILVDADACPQIVRNIVERASVKNGLSLTFFTDTNHEIMSARGEVIIVDQGHDSVDLAIVNKVRIGDVVVTQDYGLASLVLAKKAKAIHPSGMIFDENNIDFLLMDRHLSARSRKAGERFSKQRKRSGSQDLSFSESFEKLLMENA